MIDKVGVTHKAPGKRYLMRRLLVLLAAVVVLFVIVDRVSAWLAERTVASRLEVTEQLQHRPSVSVSGFPFLTQVAAGHYDEVDVTVHDLRRGGVVASKVSARLRGVHVGVSSLLSGHVGRIPVDKADATVTLTYADIDTMLRDRGLRVAFAGAGQVRVTAALSIAGQDLPVGATAAVRLDGSTLVVDPQSIDVGSASGLTSLVRGRLTVRLPLDALPFGVRVDRLEVGQGGIQAHAVAANLVIDTGSATSAGRSAVP